MLQLIERVAHRIGLVRDLEHRNVIEAVAENNHAIEAIALLHLQDRLRLRAVSRAYFEPIFIAVRVLLEKTLPTGIPLYTLVKHLNFVFGPHQRHIPRFPAKKLVSGRYGPHSGVVLVIINISLQRLRALAINIQAMHHFPDETRYETIFRKFRKQLLDQLYLLRRKQRPLEVLARRIIRKHRAIPGDHWKF